MVHLRLVLITSIFSLMLLCTSESYGFEGCEDWCQKKARAAEFDGAAGGAYLACMAETQAAGRCGPTETPASGKKTSPTTPDEESSASATSPSCQTTYQSLLRQCDNSVQSTAGSCDSKNNQGMNRVSSTAAQIALALGQQTSSSIQASCSEMAKLSQAANGALAGFRVTCSNSIDTCKSSCVELINFVKSNSSCFTGTGSNAATGMSSDAAVTAAETAKNRCDSYQSNISEANQAIQNYAATTANATQCSDQVAGGDSTTSTFCQQNPNYAGCTAATAVNCADPAQASSNKVCVCAANPTHSMCYGTQSSSSELGSVAGGSFDSSSRLGGNKSADTGGGDIPDLSLLTHGPRGRGGSGEAVDGSQGGAPVGSADGGSGGGLRGASKAAVEDESSGAVNGGFYGGGAGGRFASTGSGGNQYASGAASGSSGVNSNSKNTIPDLRKFLPGGTYDPKGRGLAGSSGPDGITGPDSDIWQKVQNRYRVMTPSLLP